MGDTFTVGFLSGVKVVAVTPTIQSTPDYSSGDVCGGLMTIAGAARAGIGTGMVTGVTITSKVALAIALDILLFKANPSNSTLTENGAVAIDPADMANFIGHISTATTDNADLGTPDVQTKLNCNIPFDLGTTNTDLYAVCVVRGTYNAASTSDLTFNFGILRD